LNDDCGMVRVMGDELFPLFGDFRSVFASSIPPWFERNVDDVIVVMFVVRTIDEPPTPPW
jgi:hypothetical protein